MAGGGACVQADGDRSAELSNANKSFAADRRVTGGPLWAACSRVLPSGSRRAGPDESR
jgi:hypothetical protein